MTENLVDIIVDEESKTVAAVVGVRFLIDTGKFTPPTYTSVETTGVSRASEPDVFDETIGTKIALGRAYIKLGRQLVKEGYKEVWKRDKARKTQEEASEKAKAAKAERVQKFVKAERRETGLPFFPVGARVMLQGDDPTKEYFTAGTVVKSNHMDAGVQIVRVDWDNGSLNAWAGVECIERVPG